jgi:hypothetical protein
MSRPWFRWLVLAAVFTLGPWHGGVHGQDVLRTADLSGKMTFKVEGGFLWANYEIQHDPLVQHSTYRPLEPKMGNPNKPRLRPAVNSLETGAVGGDVKKRYAKIKAVTPATNETIFLRERITLKYPDGTGGYYYPSLTRVNQIKIVNGAITYPPSAMPMPPPADACPVPVPVVTVPDLVIDYPPLGGGFDDGWVVEGSTDPGCFVTATLTCDGITIVGVLLPPVMGKWQIQFSALPVGADCTLCVTTTNSLTGETNTICMPVRIDPLDGGFRFRILLPVPVKK